MISISPSPSSQRRPQQADEILFVGAAQPQAEEADAPLGEVPIARDQDGYGGLERHPLAVEEVAPHLRVVEDEVHGREVVGRERPQDEVLRCEHGREGLRFRFGSRC
jgi:hypothetical protein